MDLFDLHPTVTLYDLTNTYFEGEAGLQPNARRGHSKDKRTDCPLLTLGLVLDTSGFVRRSQIFAGNVREPHTLAGMLDALHALRGALVVMDRGIATQDRVRWLREHRYRYLVVSRERIRHFDPEAALSIHTASRQRVHLHKVLSDVIAYQLVQVIRQRLRQAGQGASWTTVRRILEGQQRITATFRRADGATLHVRKATRAEPRQQAIYEALGIDPAPGGTRKTVV